MSRAVRFYEIGGPEVLRMEDVEVPAPAGSEVQIRVKAIGFNRAEALFRRGIYIEAPRLPSGLGLEAAGEVAAVGSSVRDFNVGDCVSVIPQVSMQHRPTYGEIINIPVAHVAKHPVSLGWPEAAALWMQYLTAYGALLDLAGLRKGEPVVITAASSSVGLAAIQVANAVGAIPVAVTRRDTKKQALLDAGAAHVITLAEGDIAVGLRSAVSEGVRVILDAVGGPLVAELASVMAPGGILIEHGGLDPNPTPFPLFDTVVKRLTLRGYLVHEVVRDEIKLSEAKAFILNGLTSGRLRPVVAKLFSFADIAEAHRFLESNDQFGKVVVSVS